MGKRLLALSALFGIACTLGSCERRPALVVQVPNVPPQVATLRVLVAQGTQVAAESLSFDVSGLVMSPTFSYRFGLHPPIGTSATLAIGVGAYDNKGCLVTSGYGEAVLDAMRTDEDAQVMLDDPPAAYAQTCLRNMPVLRAATQPDAAPTTLAISGWGFHPRAQVTLDGEPLVLDGPVHWDRVVAKLPNRKTPTGTLKGTVEIKNPDGTKDSGQVLLHTILFEDPSKNTYAPPAGLAPYSVQIGDLNQDGKPDLVIGGLVGTDTGMVAVYLNSGDGHFGAPDQYPFPGTVQAVTLADLNED